MSARSEAQKVCDENESSDGGIFKEDTVIR